MAESIGAENVHSSVANEGRRSRERVEHPLHSGSHALHAGAAPRAMRGLLCAGQVEEMRPLWLVELEGSRNRVEHLLGNARGVAALEARVVVDADAGEESDLLAA